MFWRLLATKASCLESTSYRDSFCGLEPFELRERQEIPYGEAVIVTEERCSAHV